jgi:hypothetical protein
MSLPFSECVVSNSLFLRVNFLNQIEFEIPDSRVQRPSVISLIKLLKQNLTTPMPLLPVRLGVFILLLRPLLEPVGLFFPAEAANIL